MQTHSPSPLTGRAAVVTGGGRGIGRAIAHALASQGASVMVADLDAGSADRVAAELASAGTGAAAIGADISNLADVDRLVDSCVSEFGALDILVNNAAVTRFVDVMDITPDDWDLMHSVNARGTFFAMQRGARHMIESGLRGGRIVNIASIAGKAHPGTSNAAYAGSKAAVIAMTAVAAQQLGKHGININSVNPGLTRTPLRDELAVQAAEMQGITTDELAVRRAASIPIGRECEPEDIAAMVAFLVGPGGDAITGQSINVDGGLVNH
jgi:NAD(P)-dependent dehydrogenase (short-subunit alcohol dehydrogenase family)